jgi:hypothetical protein
MMPLIDYEPNLDNSLDPSGPRIRCPLCAGRHETAGPTSVGMNGTRSALEACVPPDSISGLRLSVSSVAAGRRIRIGTSKTKFRLVPSVHEQTPRTGHFGTVSELKPSHTLHDHRMMNVDSQLYLNVVRMPASYPAAIKQGEHNEDEDMDGDL